VTEIAHEQQAAGSVLNCVCGPRISSAPGAQQAPLFNNMNRRVDGLVVWGTALLGVYGNATYAAQSLLAGTEWVPG
jgi:hypothetical protein